MGETFKVIIAGTRTFNNYELLKNKVPLFVNPLLFRAYKPVEIVSGGAKGADTLAVEFATEFNLPFKIFPADWKKYGKLAGPIRNKQMTEYSDAAIVFWDSKSPGSLNMIQQMRELGKPVEIVIYPKGDRENE